jgi:hypothetical protein
MICYGRMDQFDLEVKVQDKKTMVRDTSSGGGQPTCIYLKFVID